MIFRTLLFFVLMYLLVKVISRLFLAPSQKKGGRRFIYKTFHNFSPQNTGRKQKPPFEKIEEAEFEEITGDENSEIKSAD